MESSLSIQYTVDDDAQPFQVFNLNKETAE